MIPIKNLQSLSSNLIKSYQEDPNHVNAWTSLGILKFKIGKYDEASDAIKRAIKLGERDDWRALLAMGCILSDYRKHYSAAKEYFDACESLNPTSILVNLNKSQNLILLKEYVEGEKLLMKILNKIEAIEDRIFKNNNNNFVNMLTLLK